MIGIVWAAISPLVTHWAAFLAGWAGCAVVWWLAIRSATRRRK